MEMMLIIQLKSNKIFIKVDVRSIHFREGNYNDLMDGTFDNADIDDVDQYEPKSKAELRKEIGDDF